MVDIGERALSPNGRTGLFAAEAAVAKETWLKIAIRGQTRRGGHKSAPSNVQVLHIAYGSSPLRMTHPRKRRAVEVARLRDRELLAPLAQ